MLLWHRNNWRRFVTHCWRWKISQEILINQNWSHKAIIGHIKQFKIVKFTLCYQFSNGEQDLVKLWFTRKSKQIKVTTVAYRLKARPWGTGCSNFGTFCWKILRILDEFYWNFSWMSNWIQSQDLSQWNLKNLGNSGSKSFGTKIEGSEVIGFSVSSL